MNKKYAPYIFLILLVLIFLLVKGCNENFSNKKEKANHNVENKEQRGLNRNPSKINYSKHAKCRMNCRKIDETEVKDILKNGQINYRKSDLGGTECRKKYAVEGITKDNQKVRIVFAPCEDEITVVTCIDLNTDWECYCEGDESKN